MSAETKTCTKCGETKPLEAFGKRSNRPSHRSQCRACDVAQAVDSARRRKAADREAFLTRQSVYKARYAARNRERVRAHNREVDATRRADDPEGTRAKNRATEARVQLRTRAQAVHHGKEWTGPELELVSDRSRTAADVAVSLGRTRAAVKRQRQLLRIDPRKINLAGIPETPRDGKEDA